jgi:hypothetical protein
MVVRLLKILFAALVMTGAVFYSVSCSEEKVLEIRDSGSGKVYGKWPLDETGEFAVEFVHSVHQSPVREFFRIENGMIRPMSVRFYSFGAGMQSDLEEGQTLIREGDAMIVSGFRSSFRELNYIVGTVSDHLLFINGDKVSLRDLCGRNAHITIKAR